MLLFVSLHLHIVQSEILILLPRPVIPLHFHIRIWVWRVQVLQIRIRQRVIQNKRERSFDILDLLEIFEEGNKAGFGIVDGVRRREELLREYLVDLFEDTFDSGEATT